MNTIENNRLMSEFMGYNEEIVIDEVYFTLPDMLEALSDEKLHYHSDWNWLMEVVDKIENLDFKVVIDNNGCTIENLPYSNAGKTTYEVKKIEAVYNACVKFIKWYNLNK